MKRREFILFAAATLATACAGVASKAGINHERSRAVYDVIIIGGSYAGLAAALQLVRARRKVLILDAGQRRNRFAGHSHGFLGHDGQPPGAIAAKGKAEVLAYPMVTWKDALATEANRAPEGFVVRAGSNEFHGKRLILATGVVDELPSIPGLSESWGKRVLFCPYCDGYEFWLGSLGVLATRPQSAHFAMIVSAWAAPGQTTFFLSGQSDPDAHELAQLKSRGITIEREPVVSVSGDERSIDLHLRDGRTAKRDGLFLLPRARIQGPFAEELGCELETGPLGFYYRTDTTKETTVKGVFACGDIATPMPGIAFAVADGVRAGGAAHQSLIFRSE
jgi:thioredoxin reductase